MNSESFNARDNEHILENENKKIRKRNLATCFAIIPITIAFMVSSAGLAISIYFYSIDTNTNKYWKFYGILCSSYFLILSIITTLFIILLRHCSTKDEDLYKVAVEIRQLEFEATEKLNEKPKIKKQPTPFIESPNAIDTPDIRIDSPEKETIFSFDNKKPTNEIVEYDYENAPIKRKKDKVIYVKEHRKKSKNIVYDFAPDFSESNIQFVNDNPYSYYNNEIPMIKVKKRKNKNRQMVLSYIPNDGNQFIQYQEPNPNIQYIQYPNLDDNYVYTIDNQTDDYMYQLN